MEGVREEGVRRSGGRGVDGGREEGVEGGSG